jgi:hypothetical protein
MATPFDPRDLLTDDPLASFGAESGSPSPAAPGASSALAFDQIRAAGGLGFVEGVAAVQALCAGLKTAGHASPGVPDLHGVFLTASGEVIASGPPTGDAAPRELARILHQIVSPDSMPPAARLFVGRWSDSDSGSLAEFASELEYFARPNGREVLAGLYSRFEGTARSAPRPVPELTVARPERKNPVTSREKEDKKRDPDAIQRWLKAHRHEVVAAVAVITAALATGIVVWMWPAMTPVVAKQLEKAGLRASSAEEAEAQNPTADSSSDTGRTAARKTRTTRNRPNSPTPTKIPLQIETSAAPAAVSQDHAALGPVDADAAILPSTSVPDLRIYSEADAGVQPPRLRSAGIPESLLRGFERRTNAVELIVGERGDVQQVRMLNEPRRMPDIMVLSRVKELLFEPAVKNGVAVRYKLVLTWDVTP